MKTPPLLLGAALLFWGWQTGHSSPARPWRRCWRARRFSRARWEFTDEDFRRIWTFCALLLLAAALYAFTASGGPTRFARPLPAPEPGHRAQCRQRQRPDRRGADSLAADDLLPVCGRAGLQLARGHSAGDDFADLAAAVAKGAEARPAPARGAERGYLLSLLHVVPAGRELPQQRGRDLFLGLVRAGGVGALVAPFAAVWRG